MAMTPSGIPMSAFSERIPRGSVRQDRRAVLTRASGQSLASDAASAPATGTPSIRKP
jgi:hypothetical protein